MSKIFDNYQHIPTDYLPDNRPNPFNNASKSLDTILPGGTCYHTFELPCFDDELLEKVQLEVVYTQGIDTVLIKLNRSIDIIKERHAFYANVRLDKEDTLKFKECVLDTKCQLKMTIIDEIWESGESGESGEESGRKIISKDYLYSKIYKIKVLPTLIKEDPVGNTINEISDKGEKIDIGE